MGVDVTAVSHILAGIRRSNRIEVMVSAGARP